MAWKGADPADLPHKTNAGETENYLNVAEIIARRAANTRGMGDGRTGTNTPREPKRTRVKVEVSVDMCTSLHLLPFLSVTRRIPYRLNHDPRLAGSPIAVFRSVSSI